MTHNNNIIYPAPLRPGDRIAVVSPAGIVSADNVGKAVDVLRRQGWDAFVAPHALGRSGTFSGTPDERFADLRDALTDPTVRAVVCSRGGYGAVHLLGRLADLPLRADAKWLVGFSDISALHALFASRGIASIHGSMTRRLAQTGGDDPQSERLFAMLRGERSPLHFAPHPFNRPGFAEGRLAGGNLAVLGALQATPYDIFRPGDILFIEDINEPLYKTERIIEQLRLRGILPRLGALVAGRFTGAAPDPNYASVEELLRDATAPYGYPVAFDAPIGHVDDNTPVIESAEVRLTVSDAGVEIAYSPKNS